MHKPPTRSILHVDDDPQMLRIVAHLLKRRNIECHSLSDPSQAIETLMHNDCRIVLLDIDMPQRNGLDLLQDIRAFDGGIQVIMLTGLVSLSTVLQSMRWGAEACFFKPVRDIGPLADAIEAAIVKHDRWWETLRELRQRKQDEKRAIEVAT